VFPESPEIGTRLVASKTFFGVGSELDYDSTWMDNTWKNVIPRYQKGICKSRAVWQGWATGDYPISEGYWFFDTLEDRINEAVWHIANAMTWVIQQVETYTCQGGIESGQQKITRFLNIGVAFMLVSYLGVWLLEHVLGSVAGIKA